MIIIRHHETQAIETPNGNFGSSLATPQRGASEVSVVRQRQSPGGFNPAHSQNHEEVMVQLIGSVTVSSGDERIELHPGDTIIIPAQTLHRVDNTSTEDAEWLIVSKAGVRFFRETGEEAIPGWTK